VCLWSPGEREGARALSRQLYGKAQIDRHVRVTRLMPPRTNPAINPMIAPPGPMTNRAAIPHLIADNPADANPPGIGQCLQPRRNIDAISEDVVLFDDHIAEIDANPKPDALRPARRLR